MRFQIPSFNPALYVGTALICLGAAGGHANDELFSAHELDKPLTLSLKKVYVGELVELVQRETGVRLQVSDRIAPISGYELAVRVEALPARELLKGIPRLFSFPPDRWYWAREGKGTAQRLVLHNTAPAAAVLEARRRVLEQFILDQRKRNLAFAALPPAQREQQARDDPEFAPLHLQFERFVDWFSFIAEATDEELRGILRGRQIVIPVDRLSERQRAFIRQEFARAGRPNDRLDSVRIYGHLDEASPSVIVKLGPLGGPAVLGGRSSRQAAERWIQRNWVTGDETVEAGEGAVPAAGADFKPEDLRVQNDSQASLAFKIGRLGGRNVLVDRSLPGAFTAYFRLEGPRAAVLNHLSEIGMLWKRRDPLLYFRPGRLCATRSGAVPWLLRKELRAACAHQGGYLGTPEYLRLAHLSQDQLKDLEQEFPQVAFLSLYQPLIRVIAAMTEMERAAIARAEGGGWIDWTGATKQRLTVLLTPEDARRARICWDVDLERKPPVAKVFFGGGPAKPTELPLSPRRTWDENTERYLDGKPEAPPGP